MKLGEGHATHFKEKGRPRRGELDIGIHKFLDVGTTIFGNTRILTNDAQKSPQILVQIPPFLSHIG